MIIPLLRIGYGAHKSLPYITSLFQGSGHNLVSTALTPQLTECPLSEANGDPIVLKRPKFLDQWVAELPRPFALSKTNDLLSADDKLGSVAPPALCAVAREGLRRCMRSV